ncbi:MAG: ABC transporter substrate-binding protein, partial [Bacteroidetes Order II. Incertae sedis bacterium]|nr:ABC transporter substrate-binding protein [Bacteroidetes Order II. bacterium]
MRTIRILQEHVRISDPHITSDNAERLSILGNVFEPLMRANEDGSFSACLADSWHLSEDARTWSFSIMEGKRFHDGSPVTTGDVVFSLCRMRDEDIPGELGTSGVIRGYLQGATIESNGHNVTISTSVPMADLADLLSEIPILSEASVAALPDAFIGTGGFKISKVEDDQVVLESSETRLIWQAEPDPNVRFMAVQNGFADVAAKLATRHAQSNAVRIHRSATTVCATFMLNFDAKHAQNPYLRRAINLAVDVDSLMQDVMFGAADPLTGPLTQR